MSVASGLRTLVVDRTLPYRVDQVWQRVARHLSPTRVITAEGLRFRVRRDSWDEPFVQNVVVMREYLRHGLAIQPGQTVVDIGANIGEFAILAGSLVGSGGRVLTIDPDPRNLPLLRENIALNRMPWVEALPCAISDRAGELTLNLCVGHNGGGFSTLAGRDALERKGHQPVTVQGRTLADVFSDIPRCHFLKIDCEGAEFAIVDGAPMDVLRRVDQIAMEYHAPSDDPRVLAMTARLQEAGLRVVAMTSFGKGGHAFLRRD